MVRPASPVKLRANQAENGGVDAAARLGMATGPTGVGCRIWKFRLGPDACRHGGTVFATLVDPRLEPHAALADVRHPTEPPCFSTGSPYGRDDVIGFERRAGPRGPRSLGLG